jgi:hypothetical protein
MWTINEFLVATKFFNLNFVKILRFCEETQLEKKVGILFAMNFIIYSNLFDITSDILGFDFGFYPKPASKEK